MTHDEAYQIVVEVLRGHGFESNSECENVVCRALAVLGANQPTPTPVATNGHKKHAKPSLTPKS